MDTSEAYAIMCYRAEEIQSLAPSVRDGRNFWFGCNPHVWLPRQDQLQEMIEDKINMKEWRRLNLLIDCAYSYTSSKLLEEQWREIQTLESFEQLWLAFVMFEKFGKKWDGTGWIKEE